MRAIVFRHRIRYEFAYQWFGPAIAQQPWMFPRPVPISQSSNRHSGERTAPQPRTHFDSFAVLRGIIEGLRRRWARERRRRKVGRAYDMAQEIARVIPRGSEVLDVGCGNGFIAHHLSAMLGTSVVGIDLGHYADAPIDYRRYDNAQFPIDEDSVDAVLLCYVLHHAQDVSVVLNEMRRVLCAGGFAVVYEDIPGSWWDKGVCWIHNRQWRGRTGACTFRRESEWRALFESFDFEIVSERRLSRWRNLTHPVARRFYVLRKSPIHRDCPKGYETSALSAG
jgi:SAM-dependent methyltransferase